MKTFLDLNSVELISQVSPEDREKAREAMFQYFLTLERAIRDCHFSIQVGKGKYEYPRNDQDDQRTTALVVITADPKVVRVRRLTRPDKPRPLDIGWIKEHLAEEIEAARRIAEAHNVPLHIIESVATPDTLTPVIVQQDVVKLREVLKLYFK